MMDREWSKPCMIKSINKTSTINRRKFDETFKREAVEQLDFQWQGCCGHRPGVGAEGREALFLEEALCPGSCADIQSQLNVALAENRHLREQRDILKKTLGILSEPSANVTHGFEAMTKSDFSILSLCDNLNVSPGGYHGWRKRCHHAGPRALENQTLGRKIVSIFDESRETYAVARAWSKSCARRDTNTAAIASLG